MEEQKQTGNISEGFTQPKDGIPKAEIIARAWERAGNCRAQEMRRGYWNTKQDKYGNSSDTWIPDTRDLYINSVIALDAELRADYTKSFIDRRKKILDKIDTSFNRWGWKLFKVAEFKPNTKENPDPYITIFKRQYTGKVIMPEVQQHPDKKTGFCIQVPDKNNKNQTFWRDWGPNHHNFMQEMVLIYDELFEEISILLKDLKYFKGKQSKG